MVQQYWAAVVLINVFTIVLAKYEGSNANDNAITPKTYAIWRNATVPFYVNPEHFDHEQTLNILNSLAMFAFRTCIKFKPVMAKPSSSDEVLTFINPEGWRRCKLEARGHSVYTPHLVRLGYDCLKSPQIDMIIMKALGFPFEHNRPDRDSEITVLHENIEPGSVDLFTKDESLPQELRYLPYDIHSAMHFGNRDFSKNGHRTILFKDDNVPQNRVGLSATDLKKIEIVYGPECRARDRQEKILLCQSYPGVARRKREIEELNEDNEDQELVRRKRHTEIIMATKSLRVNPDITPPPEHLIDNVNQALRDLGIDNEVQEIVEHVYKVSSLALKHAREKYCNTNGSKQAERTGDIKVTKNSSDILGIIAVVAEYAQDIVDDAVSNITKFCEESQAKEVYQRAGCMDERDPRCRETYRSTKFGRVKYSTQHRPVIIFATQVKREKKQNQYARTGNDTEDSGVTKPAARRRREVETTTDKPAEKVTEANTPVTNSVDDNEKGKDSLVTTPSKAVEAVEKRAESEKAASEEKKKAVEEKKPEKDKKAEATDSKIAPVSDDKNKKVSDDEKTKEFEDKKTKVAEEKKVETKDPVVDKKTGLRMKTMIPGSRGSNRNSKFDSLDRRSYQGHNRGKYSDDTVSEDSESDENLKRPKKRIKSKIINKNMKQKIRHIEHGRKEKVEAPVEEDFAEPAGPSEVDYSQETEVEEVEETRPLKKKYKQIKQSELAEAAEPEEPAEAAEPAEVNANEREIRERKEKEEIKNTYSSILKNKLVKLFKNPTAEVVSNDVKQRIVSQVKKKVGKLLNAPVADVSASKEGEEKETVKEIVKETVVKHVKKNREKERKESAPVEVEVEVEERQTRKPKKRKVVKESRVPLTVTLTKKNEDFYEERKWPDGNLYFMIQEDTTYDLTDMRRRLAAVNAILKRKTCVKMVEIKPEDAERYEDYVLIDNSPDYVTGKVGGKQKFGAIELFRGGQHRQHAAMMVMAMLGFYFEVARHDREKYIRVHMRHVRPDKLHHFEMIRSDATLPLPYDYASATHPAWQFWRQMGRTGISTVATLKEQDPDGTLMKSLGQNAKLLSDSDIIKINSVYGVDCFRNERAKVVKTTARSNRTGTAAPFRKKNRLSSL